jgi:hypothetical protein
MRHMVIYRSMDGGPTYHETDDLDGAVRAVEHLRNSQNVTETRIFSLQEVPIEVKTYYRVEVVAPEYQYAAPAPSPEPEPVSFVDPPAQTEPAPVLESVSVSAVEAPGAEELEFNPPTPVLPSASSRFGLFSRG